ncbi:MAG: hypothetical protein HYZ50_23775 [Deltaproteobacteria bacterium]|nr:hypothetical protein [Deltaproteobacteria bacterium]
MRALFVITFTCCFGFLLTVAVPVNAASLASLKDASCELYALSQADIAVCEANPTCLANEEIGAYLRNGGATSKLAKMCRFRVDDWVAACAAGNVAVARFVATAALKAMENWVDQSVQYCKRGQMNCTLVIDRFGTTWVSLADFAGTQAVARNHMWAIAKGLPLQANVEPLALSILGELYNRLEAPTVCAEE